MKHEHAYIVRTLNELRPDKAGRDYWYRISVCEGDEGCGAWFSEGAFSLWPDTPAIGDALRDEPSQLAMLGAAHTEESG